MAITLCAITGTIVDATGVAVEAIAVQLIPESQAAGAGVTQSGGFGVVVAPVETTTASDGTFSISGVQGRRYTLKIEAIGYERTFTCPVLTTIKFDLLGYVPNILAITDWVTDDGDDMTATTFLVDPLIVIMERFTTIELESSPDLDGPWTAVSSTDLKAGQQTYVVEDTADSTTYYRARYQGATATAVDRSDYCLQRWADSNDAELLFTVGELISTYLFGVNLTNPDTGEPYPDIIFTHFINAAIAWLEKALDIPLVARDFSETFDHYSTDFSRWGWFKLNNYPVIKVDQVALHYPSFDTNPIVLNDDWVVLEDNGVSGVIQIVPGRGTTFPDAIFIPGVMMPLLYANGSNVRVPGIWAIDYRAGFEVGTLSEDLKHVIGMAAAMGVLNIAGDLIAGAGIASLSISIPGLSQSIGTTSSATNAGYGSRIIQYTKEIKDMLPMLKRFYGKGTRLVVA